MADGARPSLEVEERPERGSRSVRRLRRAGYVPGIVYGGDDAPTPFKVGGRELRLALQDGSAVIDLKVGSGRARPVIVKDEQRHPVRDDLLHIDLLQVRLDEKIHATVSVELEGVEDAPGVREGGVLEHVTRELNIEALPTDIPERVVVDVSEMEIAGTLSLAEVAAPRGVAYLDDADETVIATITAPSQVELPEDVEEETQLVGEEAVATDVPAEGEGQPSGGEPTAGEKGEAGPRSI
ncbi:MAG: 50S ribosomal protein L25 [Actinomycetota bacterium]|nr:50S ribosomal protein L25 [Actinomycetota bacterium]